MSNEEKPYYIVEFSDGIQLIPHNWFNPSKNKAYWPNFINITKYDKAVKNMQLVGEDWNLYDVIKIFGSAQTFESGKRKLKLAETISDLNTDVSDGEKSKKERRRKAAKTFDTDSDTDSDSQIIESLLEPFPIINAHKAKTVNTIIDSKFESLQKVDNQSASTSFQSNDDILISDCEFSITSKKRKRDEIPALNSKNKKIKKNNIEKDFKDDKENLQPCISTEEQEFQKFVVKNMMHTKMGLKRCENILTDILTILKTSNLSRTEDYSTSINDTLDELPIKDSENLQKVEYLLKTNESYKNSLIKMLTMVGGNDLKSVTINILTRTLTNSAASEYSWLGGKKKLVFSNLYLWKIILGIVRRHIPHAVESDISKHIKIWLAHATERLHREEKKNKSLESVSIEKQMGTALEIALQNDMIISS